MVRKWDSEVPQAKRTHCKSAAFLLKNHSLFVGTHFDSLALIPQIQAVHIDLTQGESLMTRSVFLGLIFLLFAVPVIAQQEANADREAVRQAVLDYVEGIYNVQPERIERSVSQNLAKLGFYRPPAETAYRPGRPMAFQQLVEIAKTYNKEGKLRKDAPKDIQIYDVLDQTATVKLTAEWGTDYMHLAKLDGKWMIVNVLWQSHPPNK
jgi:Putative lumazine-binding